jgi:hypothetical protein
MINYLLPVEFVPDDANGAVPIEVTDPIKLNDNELLAMICPGLADLILSHKEY